jgi:hypothetical protein
MKKYLRIFVKLSPKNTLDRSNKSKVSGSTRISHLDEQEKYSIYYNKRRNSEKRTITIVVKNSSDKRERTFSLLIKMET